MTVLRERDFGIGPSEPQELEAASVAVARRILSREGALLG